MDEITIPALAPDRFDGLVEPAVARRFGLALERATTVLDGRTLWHLNSTARGGGVAELLRSLLGYVKGGGVRTRWCAIDGGPAFFDLTKRLHVLLHGAPSEGTIGGEERRVYESGLAASAGRLSSEVGPGDVVVLHDPQTLGLAPALRDRGARLIWSCHIGVDEPNEHTQAAWDFLRTYVDTTDAQVFSRRAYAWAGLDPDVVDVIPPCIDAFSAKNADLDDADVEAILAASDVAPGDQASTSIEVGGRRIEVERAAERIEEEPVPPSATLVAQVSRWDRLKDPVGVLEGFDRHVAPATDAHLVLAGPAIRSVRDDPESGEVFGAVRTAWSELSHGVRRRVHLVCLPMEDVDENAAIVNAIQRRADVIVQKSLAEGFGLTVAEAMWKRRPVVGSRVGGIQDQIVDGESGVLVPDPRDLAAFGRAVTSLIEDPENARRMGRSARARVTEAYLPPHYLARQLDLVGRVMDTAPSGMR